MIPVSDRLIAYATTAALVESVLKKIDRYSNPHFSAPEDFRLARDMCNLASKHVREFWGGHMLELRDESESFDDIKKTYTPFVGHLYNLINEKNAKIDSDIKSRRSRSIA